MKKYSEITLTDDERKLLEVLKNSGVTEIKRDCYGTLIVRKNQYGTVLQFFDGFDWIGNNEEYDIPKLLNPPHEPKTVWELEIGDEYYYISNCGSIERTYWNFDNFDRAHLSQGNSFLTKEEAEFELKRREVVTKVRKYARPFKYGKLNFYPYYEKTNATIDFYTNCYSQANHDYFASEDDIRKAIEDVGEEDFKKYYLGVTE